MESLNLKVSKGPEETTVGKLSFSMTQIIPSKSGFPLGFRIKALKNFDFWLAWLN
jgi:hypothetical protein